MKNSQLFHIILCNFSYEPKSIQDTELGKLRILENDVKEQALTKSVFKKGKEMASRGDAFFWFVISNSAARRLAVHADPQFHFVTLYG